MSKAAFIGTFDPITIGHLDIITRASKFFDTLDIVLMRNEAKNPIVSVSERLSLIKKCTKGMQNVEVNHHIGLAIDYCSKNSVDCLIRGIRSPLDTDYELSLAWANMDIGNLQTVFIPVNSKYLYISSTLARELLANNGDISKVIPKIIIEDVTKLYKVNK